MTDNHQLRLSNIWVVPYLSQDSGLGIVQGFITHFITHLVNEVEWNGDGDVVVGEIKRPFSVFRRNNKHSSQFNDKGIPNNLISKVIKKAVKEAKIVGTSGKNRDVYETKVNGRVVHIAITISDNGYIVGAHPTSTWKEKKQNEKEVTIIA